MPTDFLALLGRDHLELDRGLAALAGPIVSIAELRATLDGVRLGLTAHAAAADIVLSHALARCTDDRALEPLVDRTRRTHLGQEAALIALLCVRPATALWRERAERLRELVREHAIAEEQTLVPALQEHAPGVYASLAGAFATERLRQLALLQPSAPVVGIAAT
jgi:hypothetical protein